jgi:hypothetical protein
MPRDSEPLHAAPKRVEMNAEDLSSASWSLNEAISLGPAPTECAAWLLRPIKRVR